MRDIAIPHTRTDQVKRRICTVGRQTSGIDFNGDGRSRLLAADQAEDMWKVLCKS